MLDARTFAYAVSSRPSWLMLPLMECGALDWLDDERYLKMSYRIITGASLGLHPPKTFNEKIAWCKLHDRNPRYRVLADKLRVREFLSSFLGNEWIVPLLGVWDNPDAIDFEALPDRFVLKCTHGYGGTVICYDSSSFDVRAARKTLATTFKTDFYGRGREWAYSEPEPRIIAEAFIGDGQSRPIDYKFMCFNGHVGLVCISRAVSADHHHRGEVSFLYPDGVRAPFKRVDYPDFYGLDLLPESYLDMYEAAERLAVEVGAPFLRVDFYEADGRPYFSEFTFYPCGGTMILEPAEYNRALGDLIRLPFEG